MSDVFENPGYVYESPDGGNTIYRRLPGTSQRDLVKENTTLIAQLREDQLWGQIRRMARTDAALQDILERAIIYYNLKRDHSNKTIDWHPV